MNTSMFLPQSPEQDLYDANGNQLDDITSIVELVRVKLGYDHHADDENDDTGQNFHVPHSEYTFEPFLENQNNDLLIEKSDRFSDFREEKISPVAFDIIIPPPKAYSI